MKGIKIFLLCFAIITACMAYSPGNGKAGPPDKEQKAVVSTNVAFSPLAMYQATPAVLPYAAEAATATADYPIYATADVNGANQPIFSPSAYRSWCGAERLYNTKADQPAGTTTIAKHNRVCRTESYKDNHANS